VLARSVVLKDFISDAPLLTGPNALVAELGVLKLKALAAVGEAADSPKLKGWLPTTGEPPPKLKLEEAGLLGLLPPKPNPLVEPTEGLPGWLPVKLNTKLGTLSSPFFALVFFLLINKFDLVQKSRFYPNVLTYLILNIKDNLYS
jgi:hypothetical protein